MIRYRMDIANLLSEDYCNQCWVEPTADPKGAWLKAEDVEQELTALRAQSERLETLTALLVGLRDNAALLAQAAIERFKPGAVVAYSQMADELTAVVEVLHRQPMREVPLAGSESYRVTYELAARAICGKEQS